MNEEQSALYRRRRRNTHTHTKQNILFEDRKKSKTVAILFGDRSKSRIRESKGSGNRTRIFGVGILKEHGRGLRFDGDAALLFDLEKIEHLSGRYGENNGGEKLQRISRYWNEGERW